MTCSTCKWDPFICGLLFLGISFRNCRSCVFYCDDLITFVSSFRSFNIWNSWTNLMTTPQLSCHLNWLDLHYKQLHGTAMGSPVSVVVAEIVMQNIEEQALATYTRTVPLWIRYVDDTFTAVHKDGIDDFHEHLTDRMRPYSSPRRSKKMVRYLF